jgi:pyruvate/2-oxoglutarate dehydrogenase complex dihydrolipoamide acyltransferase (E2) component
MTRLRKRVAERLLEAKNSTAMLTTFNEVNMKPIMDLRKQYGDAFEKRHGIRLGFMSFYVKAVVEALKRYPQGNVSTSSNAWTQPFAGLRLYYPGHRHVPPGLRALVAMIRERGLTG